MHSHPNRILVPALAAVTSFLTAVAPVAAQDESAGDGPSVTIYSSADPAGFDPQRFLAQQRQGYNPSSVWQVPGFGVVKEVRSVELDQGINTLRFTDVAEFIDPTTVSFTDLTSDGTSVLEQNFEFDLVSPSKLLEKYVDREISAVVTQGERVERVAGTLLAANQGQLVIRTDDGIRLVPASASVTLGELPEGLITRPTLVWKLAADEGGAHRVRTAYQTDGLTWRSDYNLVLDEEETSADLGAWVTLMNLSGAAYENARLKLVAGDVQRVRPEDMRLYAARAAVGEDAGFGEGFQEKSFFEYHLYTLPRRTDILANTTQQIRLFPTADDVDVEKILVYRGVPAYHGHGGSPQTARELGGEFNSGIDVHLRFRNEERNNLGMPLPAGKVRVYKEDPADGTLEFVGEDVIDHTPRDEEVLIRVGRSFDVVAERTQTDFSVDTRARRMTETIRVQIRNHKDEAATVIVREDLFRWRNWEITEADAEWEKVDATTIEFPLDVPANGQTTVTYTVLYTW